MQLSGPDCLLGIMSILVRLTFRSLVITLCHLSSSNDQSLKTLTETVTFHESSKIQVWIKLIIRNFVFTDWHFCIYPRYNFKSDMCDLCTFPKSNIVTISPSHPKEPTLLVSMVTVVTLAKYYYFRRTIFWYLMTNFDTMFHAARWQDLTKNTRRQKRF